MTIAATVLASSLCSNALATAKERTFPVDKVHTCVEVGLDVVVYATFGIGAAVPGVSTSTLGQGLQSLAVLAKALDSDRQVVLPKQVRSAAAKVADAAIREVAGFSRATSDTDRQAVIDQLKTELVAPGRVVQDWFLKECAFLSAPECKGAGNPADTSSPNSTASFTTKRFTMLVTAVTNALRSNRACADAISNGGTTPANAQQNGAPPNEGQTYDQTIAANVARDPRLKGATFGRALPFPSADSIMATLTRQGRLIGFAVFEVDVSHPDANYVRMTWNTDGASLCRRYWQQVSAPDLATCLRLAK